MVPDLEKAASKCTKHETGIQKAEAALNSAVDKVFAKFCKEIRVANIREYETQRLSGAQARAKERLQYSKQIAALRSNLEYERNRDTEEDVVKFQGIIKADEKEMKTIEAKMEDLQKVIEKGTDQLAELREGLKEKQAELEKMNEDTKAVRNELKATNAKISSIQKAVTSNETQREQQRSQRHRLFKKCKLEEIYLPLADGSVSPDDLLETVDEAAAAATSGGVTTSGSTGPPLASADLDTADTEVQQRLQDQEAQIALDYSDLPDELCEDIDDQDDIAALNTQFSEKLRDIAAQIEGLAPNLKAVERLDGVKEKLKASATEYEETLQTAHDKKAAFEQIKQERVERFRLAFDHVSGCIDDIYKALTHSAAHTLGGQAYLNVEHADEPYLSGTRFTAMPPMKRFRNIEQLSGGEKTVAALALLFAIHSYNSVPFFVLDEVDAALDNVNVHKVARYISSRTKEQAFQCIVISLKDSFYDKADSLVGIYREQSVDCSRVVTVDLSQYQDGKEDFNDG
eukprot:m.357413 g.357413  ORF g.357413 m.357413 type:complete len:515 (-) comp19941_c4_seq6:110-1654(-)